MWKGTPRPAATGAPSGPGLAYSNTTAWPSVRPLNTLSPVMLPAAVTTTRGCASSRFPPSGSWYHAELNRLCCCAGPPTYVPASGTRLGSRPYGSGTVDPLTPGLDGLTGAFQS